MTETRPAYGRKYGNRKVEWQGVKFDSQAELHDYLALLARQQAGEISGLRRQVRYQLLEGFRDRDGHWYRAITYTVDFDYWENGQVVCWDTKGALTQQGRLREKLFRHRYSGIKLIINYASRRR